MKVLWLCNIMLPAIAEKLGLPYSNREGWLSGSFSRIRKEFADTGKEAGEGCGTGKTEGLKLGVCFPVEEMPAALLPDKKMLLDGAVCYAFVEKLAVPERYDAGLENAFRKILEDFRPDIVHIFGAEFPHALAMTRAFHRPDRTLIGMQGLTGVCARVYLSDIPSRVRNRITFRDLVRRDGVKRQQEKFKIRGEREREAIRNAGHITGRTDFDRRETEKMNPSARYHFMNETMREPFYSGSWDGLACGPHTVFLSQGDYPLKGLHYALRAMPRILREYPDAEICVAGNNIIAYGTWKERLKISSYGKYLLELIRENRLESRVTMTGRLTAEEMKERFLKSSLYLCPSALENSPNSLCEAMLLGVPVVAAEVGGIPSLLAHGTEGLLYAAGNVDALAEAVLEVWRKPKETAVRAGAAQRRARRTHDADANYRRLLEIYGEMDS